MITLINRPGPYTKILTGLLASICLVLVTTGCQTTNPYTGEQQTSNATKGAAIGAAAGAILGIVTSDEKKDRMERAMVGAGIGAVAGGSVGYYMDLQEARLRDKLRNTGVSITRNGDNIILNMPGDITFDTDKSYVKQNFVSVLDSVSEVLREYESTMIEVAGHTDSRGSQRYNQLLAESRARAVADQLTRFGVQTVRIDRVGYGENYPVADNATAYGRQLNRRVELTLLPYTQS